MFPRFFAGLFFMALIYGTRAQQGTPVLFFYSGKYSPPADNKLVTGGSKLILNRDVLRQLYQSRSATADIKIQLENEELLLQLSRTALFTYNRPEVIMAGNLQSFKYTPGYYLSGTVAGHGQSVVALSIFENYAGGMLSYGGNNYTLSVANPGNDLHTGEYILFADRDYQGMLPGCTEADDNLPLPVIRDIPQSGNSVGCSVDIYFELSYEMFSQFGGDNRALMDYFTILFNGVQSLYNNEDILVQIREVKIWDVPEPEINAVSSSSALYSFSSRMEDGFNGDLAHYVTFKNLGGGIAWRNVLCRSNAYYRTAVSGSLRINYTPFPAYSFSINVIAHETGHNLGSRHTHNCTWPGGPIDGCAPVDDGPCTAGPLPPAGGGTIMSYCHTRPSIGINFANGFGPLPGNLIRTNVTNASFSSCLCSCSDISLDILTQDVGCGAPFGSAAPVITNGTGPFTFLWSNGSTDSVATGLSEGIYFVKVTGADGTCTVIKGCRISTTGNALTVGVSPSVTAVSKCLNETHTMSVSVNPAGSYNFQWYSNNVAIPGATGTTYTAAASGTYHVTVSNGACEGRSASINVNIQNIPAFSISVNGTPDICVNDSVRLSVPVSGYAVEWLFNNNPIPGAAGNTYFARAAGNYSARLYSPGNPACNSTAVPVTVQVKPSPQALISPAGRVSLCQGEKVILTHTPEPGTTFRWLKGSVAVSGATGSRLEAATSGIYAISVTGTNGCVSVSPATSVVVNPLPDSIMQPTGTRELCSGGSESLFINNPGTDYTYRWYNNQQQIPGASRESITVTTAGRYSAVITDNFTGCSSTSDTTVFNLVPPPVIFAGNDTVLSTGQPYRLFAREIGNRGVTRFEWSPPTGLSNPAVASPVVILNADQTYMVKGIHPSGCFGTDSVLIRVFKGPAIYVPSAFSPNGDGLNDRLKCVAVGLSSFKYFDIYNRLGERLFRTTNTSVGWDGTFKGSPVDPGTYVWIAEGINFKGEPMLLKGTVVILR